MGKIPWRRRCSPVFLPGDSHGQRSLAGYSPWGRKESDATERLTLLLPLHACPSLEEPAFTATSETLEAPQASPGGTNGRGVSPGTRLRASSTHRCTRQPGSKARLPAHSTHPTPKPKSREKPPRGANRQISDTGTHARASAVTLRPGNTSFRVETSL